MQKTQNYNLNKPDPTDPIRIADLNANADAIDTALGGLNTAIAGKADQSQLDEVRVLASTEKVVIGSFEGTGLTGRTLNLGFTAKFIVLMSEMNSKAFLTLALPEFGLYMNSTDMMLTSSRVVTNGVYIAANGNNSDSGANYYLAVL